MPYIKDELEKMRALAEGPTLGNLHPDARAQAIARAGLADMADVERAAQRLRWLHSAAAVDAEGFEWGVFRVKWENGRAVDVQRTRADHADLDAALAAPGTPGADRQGIATELHQQIMNLPCSVDATRPVSSSYEQGWREGYAMGYGGARQAAAELVLSHLSAPLVGQDLRESSDGSIEGGEQK